jgi:hypothetical protein
MSLTLSVIFHKSFSPSYLRERVLIKTSTQNLPIKGFSGRDVNDSIRHLLIVSVIWAAFSDSPRHPM